MILAYCSVFQMPLLILRLSLISNMSFNSRHSLWRNSPRNYGAISFILHWLMALLVFFMFVLGWGQSFVPSLWKPVMMQIHVGLGILILFLFLARIAWRIYNCPPKPLPSLPKMMKTA